MYELPIKLIIDNLEPAVSYNIKLALIKQCLALSTDGVGACGGCARARHTALTPAPPGAAAWVRVAINNGNFFGRCRCRFRPHTPRRPAACARRRRTSIDRAPIGQSRSTLESNNITHGSIDRSIGRSSVDSFLLSKDTAGRCTHRPNKKKTKTRHDTTRQMQRCYYYRRVPSPPCARSCPHMRVS